MLNGRVLIIDDEPAVAESLSQLLAARGHETAAECDGIAGLHRVEKFHPSVVIADVLMPRLDGFGLLRKLREHHPEIAVILLTGRGSVEMAVRALQEEGAYHYFEKPFDIEKLCLVVERALEYGAARAATKTSGASCASRGRLAN